MSVLCALFYSKSPPNNTYESLPSYPNAGSPTPLADPETLEYAYADASVVTARVASQGGVTAGFTVQDGKQDDSMEINVAYESSLLAADPSKDKEHSLTQSTANNPLYGSK